MFSDRGNPCGLFNIYHIMLVILTLIIVVVLLYMSRSLNKEKIKKISKIASLIILFLETIKITYNFIYGYFEFTYWLPLSYCAIFMFALFLSAYFKGKVEKIGISFVSTCSIAGLAFIIFPLTSLTEVPFYHFLSIYSFIYHGAMVYFGLLYLFKVNRKVDFKTFLYQGIISSIFIIIAFIINISLDLNLMFVSKPATFSIDFLDKLLNNSLYPLISTLTYLFIPFLISYLISKIKVSNS